MSKTKLISILVAVTVILSGWPDVVMAENLGAGLNSARSVNCKKQICNLAQMIANDQVTDAARVCYEALSDADKALVFEMLATFRGIDIEILHKEALQNSQGVEMTPMINGEWWRQPVERIPFSAVGKTLYPSSGSWSDPLCDNDSSDVDYVFRFIFPAPMSDPEALRSFSYHLGVDAMRVWYQVQYGGVTGFGSTSSYNVYICLGDTGVATAGGQPFG